MYQIQLIWSHVEFSLNMLFPFTRVHTYYNFEHLTIIVAILLDSLLPILTKSGILIDTGKRGGDDTAWVY